MAVVYGIMHVCPPNLLFVFHKGYCIRTVYSVIYSRTVGAFVSPANAPTESSAHVADGAIALAEAFVTFSSGECS